MPGALARPHTLCLFVLDLLLGGCRENLGQGHISEPLSGRQRSSFWLLAVTISPVCFSFDAREGGRFHEVQSLWGSVVPISFFELAVELGEARKSVGRPWRGAGEVSQRIRFKEVPGKRGAKA